MECNFWVGQKVVCVDNEGLLGNDIPPDLGKTYTIRDIGPIPGWQILLGQGNAGYIGVRLEEIFRRPRQGSVYIEGLEEPMYRPSRFRPLVKTDISALEALLIQSDQTIKDLEDA